MSPTLIIALALLVVSGLAAFGPSLATVKGWFGAAGTVAKPDRIAARAAYDTLKAYLGDDADLKAIWGKLS